MCIRGITAGSGDLPGTSPKHWGSGLMFYSRSADDAFYPKQPGAVRATQFMAAHQLIQASVQMEWGKLQGFQVEDYEKILNWMVLWAYGAVMGIYSYMGQYDIKYWKFNRVYNPCQTQNFNPKQRWSSSNLTRRQQWSRNPSISVTSRNSLDFHWCGRCYT